MIQKIKLANGLTVLLEPIESVLSISVGMWVKAGSRDESESQYGYAHFVEHMLFKGTSKYSAKELAKVVDRVGGQHNAATNREYTCYYINVISDYLEMAVEILSDMYQHPAFDKDEFQKEKNVILEEIKMTEDTPDELIHDVFAEVMLTNKSLSHSILGSIDSITSATPEKLREFYEENYFNQNAFLVISGKVDVPQALKLIEKYFVNDFNHAVNPPISLKQTDEVFRRHIFRDLEQTHFCLGTKGLTKGDDDRWALYLLNTVIGGSASSRLFQKLREEEGLCYSVYSFHSSFVDDGFVGVYCGTSTDNYKKAKNLIVQELKEIIKNGITLEELEDTKTMMKGNLALSMESTEFRMSQLARSEMVYGCYYSFEEVSANFDKVTLADIRSIIDRIFAEKRLSLVSIGDFEAKDNEAIYISLKD